MKKVELSLDIEDACVVISLVSAVACAEKKHPGFVNTPEQAVSVLGEEFGEFAQAINDKDFNKAENEVLDIMAVCTRFLKAKTKFQEGLSNGCN
ncbi:MAG: hypothetical protein II972_01820 [Elusimicrobiaceae bacterium]|nr:hypothetical protein [Elusimicrobiaceae bacterium]